MTTNITPVSQHDGATLSRNVDGEDAYMDGGSAPLGTVLQKLADRAEFAKDATAFSRPAWSESLYVASGGTNSSFTVGIGAISHVQTYRSGTTTHKVYAYAGGTIGASKIEGGGNLANSTWYYVYAYDNAGSLDFEISVTAPNDNLCIKSGDSTRIYLGCFKTDSSGAPLPMRRVNNLCLYRFSGLAANDLRALNAGTTTGSYATVALATWIPPHARVARLRGLLKAVAGIGGQGLAYVQTAGDTGGGSETLFTSATAGEYGGHSFDVETDASRQVQYQNSIANLELTLYVHGWYE